MHLKFVIKSKLQKFNKKIPSFHVIGHLDAITGNNLFSNFDTLWIVAKSF